ncbi:gamma-glutamyl kinase [Pseudophaeobacter arcticus]|uniref:Gamma-glutamyl kinase n=2 Tax=Pseudophaeobacter arcticus TaxID=385492 RepID=A0ABQ0AMF0_9RHOB
MGTTTFYLVSKGLTRFMLVFYDEKLVLLSVPKTGTSAYQEALQTRADLAITNPPELKHAPLYRYNRWIRPMFERVCDVELEVAAVMREPVSWLGSWYRFRQRPFMEGKPNATHGISFDQFVRGYCKGQQPGYANVGSQAKFLETQKNGCHVTHLFRYEDQSVIQSFLEQRLDVKITLQKRNVSPVMDLTLSPEIEALYRRKKPEEFELYDSTQ